MSELNDSKSWAKEGKGKVLHIISAGLVKDAWLFCAAEITAKRDRAEDTIS